MKNNILRGMLLFSAMLVLPFAVSAGSLDEVRRSADEAFAELEGIELPSRKAVRTEEDKGGKAGRNKSKSGKNKAEKTNTETVSDADNELMLVNAVLKGTGIGKDEETARIKAVESLSKSIVVMISSQTVLSREKINDQYSQVFTDDVSLRSDTFLKNIHYTKPVIKPEGAEVTACMTAESVVNTVVYLIKTMPRDLETLSPGKFDDVLTSIYLAYSLLFAVSDDQVPQRQKYIALLTALKNEIEKIAAYGSLYFSSEYGAKGQVEIAGAKYDLNSKIFLKPGTYKFSVKLNGYRNLGGKVTLAKGDKKFVELVLVPENLGKKEVFLRVDSPVRMIDDIEKVLLDFGITPTQNTKLPHQIVVVLKGTATKVDQYEKYALEVDVHTFKNGQKFKITHYEHKPFFVTPQNRQEKIREETKKVSAAVVKKFLSSIDLNEFFAE